MRRAASFMRGDLAGREGVACRYVDRGERSATRTMVETMVEKMPVKWRREVIPTVRDTERLLFPVYAGIRRGPHGSRMPPQWLLDRIHQEIVLELRGVPLDWLRLEEVALLRAALKITGGALRTVGVAKGRRK